MTADSYLCFYYVSSLSSLPVREVNRLGGANEAGEPLADCKSDPNLETGTFGLFSTCQAQARRAIVERRSPYIFFFGTCAIGKRVTRCVTGYYRLGWFAHGGTHAHDYCLAAKSSHFVGRPVPFEQINRELGTALSNRNPLRTTGRLGPGIAEGLVEILHRQPNATADYVAEIRRLERINIAASGGFRYINFGRTDSFTWDDIRRFDRIGIPSVLPRVGNKSLTGRWECENCHHTLQSFSRLKLCPSCGASGTLISTN